MKQNRVAGGDCHNIGPVSSEQLHVNSTWYATLWLASFPGPQKAEGRDRYTPFSMHQAFVVHDVVKR